jgi:hypothetical protein
MASTFKYHSQVDEVVPWQATYSFPTQATKINKQTVKLVPKNGSNFKAGNIIRIEFPADNYLNVLNSVLQFDVQFRTSPLIPATACTDLTGISLTDGNSTLSFTFNVDDFWTTGATAYAILANTKLRGQVLAVTKDTGETYYSVIGDNDITLDTDPTPDTNTIRLTELYPPLPNLEVTDKMAIYPGVAFQRGGAQNLIKRLRVLYGSLVLEDIYEYKTLVRILYEAGVSEDYTSTHGQIVDGMYSSYVQGSNQGMQNIDSVPRSAVVIPERMSSVLQCVPPVNTDGTSIYSNNASDAWGTPSAQTNFSGQTTYCINLLSGILTQKKLLPLKWMAAQFALEITLATEDDALLIGLTGDGTDSIIPPTKYLVSNVNYIAEMLEFDSAYDTAFYDGLRAGGVPLKFASFHYHSFNLSGLLNIVQIHERARSVKFALAVCRDIKPVASYNDSDRFFHDLAATYNTTTGSTVAGWSGSTLHEEASIVDPFKGQIMTYQWRIGGRYYPAQPVNCLYGGSEAYIELQKTLDNLGDYGRGSQITVEKWSCHNGNQGSAFIMAAPFENTDVFPETISGINAEEQSDIALTIQTSAAVVEKKLDVFMSYDALMIVRDGNVVDLVL